MFLSSSRRSILPLARSSRSVGKYLSVLNNGNFLLCSRYHNSTSSDTAATVGSTPSSSTLADTVHKGMKGIEVPGPDHLEKLATSFSQLTLKEMNELQRLIFKKIGHSDDFYEKALLQGLGGGGGGGGGAMAPAITAAAPVADAAAAPPPTPPKPEKKKVEKLTADVKLAAYAPEIKIKLIKELRTVTSMSIADAKKAVEKCPGLVATNLSKDDAEKIKVAFEKLGAKVEVI